MHPPSLDASWLRAWRGVGANGDGAAVFHMLVACYNEAHRRYHTVQHLLECLAAFEQARHLALHPAEVEVALWFHDAVYDVKRSDNEERSSRWAETVLKDANAPANAVELVSSLVLITKHTRLPARRDEELLVDIDISILGASERRFAEYERQVREEYAVVPDFIFRRRRRAILQSFLQRQRIYSTEHFYAALEHAARHNLQCAIDELSGLQSPLKRHSGRPVSRHRKPQRPPEPE